MITALRRNPFPNLGVAADALENRSARAKGVALNAAQGTVQVAMGIGKTAGRELPEKSAVRPKEDEHGGDFSQQLQRGTKQRSKPGLLEPVAIALPFRLQSTPIAIGHSTGVIP